jgi:hypothetical protein
MQYELAKKLKDAGFRQDFYSAYLKWDKDDKEYNWEDPNCSVIDKFFDLSVPDLSDLIEACGHYFYQLTKEDDGSWTCASINGYPKSGFGVTNSPTPEEAVAKLWLALNKK